MEPIGILAFTSQESMQHKQDDGKHSEGNYCYWETAKFPVRFKKHPTAQKRLYLAVKGQVKGYFIINKCLDNELQFDSESWVEIENGQHKRASQRWRYYLHPDQDPCNSCQTECHNNPTMDGEVCMSYEPKQGVLEQ